MIELVSTLKEKPQQIHYCVVYDQQTGTIVSRHGFVGDGTGLFGPEGQAERGRIALEGAKQRHKSTHLRAMHPPGDFRFEPDVLHRVDVQTGKLVPVKRFTLTELMERRKKK
jgi:hypothetical protein